MDSIVGTGDQGHEMNPGLKHDASGEVHKQIVGEDIILMDERKKEEQEVNTGTGGKVHLGRDKTGEHHVVILGPTPSAIHKSKIQYDTGNQLFVSSPTWLHVLGEGLHIESKIMILNTNEERAHSIQLFRSSFYLDLHVPVPTGSVHLLSLCVRPQRSQGNKDGSIFRRRM